MSYANERKRISPNSLAAAVIFNGSIILAVAMSPHVVEPRLPGPIMIARPIALDPPPEPKLEKPRKAREMPPIFAIKPISKMPDNDIEIKTSADEQIISTVID